MPHAKPIRAAASTLPLGVIQATLTIQAAAPTVAGEAPKNPRFALSAYNGGPMRVDGWRAPVVVDLQGLSVAAQKLPVYCNHEQTVECLLGQTGQITVSEGRLAAGGDITGRSQTCQAVMAHSANGFEWQASIGASVDQNEFLADGKTAIVNGRSVSGPVNIARKSTLGEISFVALGADTSTSARIAAKAAQENAIMEFAQWLKAEFGLDAAGLDADQTAKFTAKYEAAKKQGTGDQGPGAGATVSPPVKAADAGAAPPVAPPDPVADLRARTANEYDRIGKLQTLAAKHPTVLAQAIREGWDEPRTTTEVKLADLQASRAPGAPAVHGGYALTAKAIEAAACMSCGISDEKLAKDRTYGEQVVEAARRLPRYMGPSGIMELCARMEGIDLPVDRRSNDWIRAAFSTTSLSNLLSNLQNKLLLEGYNSVEQTWRLICRKGPLNDYKVHTRIRLVSDMIFEKLGQDGEIKHGKLDEQPYTIQGDIYAKMLSLTQKMIVNDDLSALQDQPMQLGIGAADAINDAVWTAFLANLTTFFPVNNSQLNYISGAATALCFDSIGQLYGQFLKQTKPNGRPLGVRPEILLVPAELEMKALQLVQSQFLMPALVSASGPAGGNPQDNIFAKKFQVAASAYLSNSAYPGYSATAFYMLTPPTRLHLLEVGFLNAQEMPVVERAETDFDTLGIQFRGFFAFGVGTGEYRAGAMSKGAA